MYDLLAGLLYLVGLVLIVMPPESLPISGPRKPAVRLTKHTLGLLLFLLGTMRIHRRIRHQVGAAFLIGSIFLILSLAIVRVWMEKRS